MVEQRLEQVYHSRQLYSANRGQFPSVTLLGSKMSTKGTSKNQISIPLRIRLQSICIELLCNRAEELLFQGRSLFDSAQKVKTMGLDKHKLMLALVEMCSLSQIIVILLPVLLSSSAPSSSTKPDSSYLAVDIERVTTLAESSLTALLSFLASNVSLLTTHPQLLKEFLLRLHSLVASWTTSHTCCGGMTSVDHAASKDNEYTHQNPRDTDSGILDRSSDPLGPYQHLLHPLATFLIEYLANYCSALQKQSKDGQVHSPLNPFSGLLHHILQLQAFIVLTIVKTRVAPFFFHSDTLG